jgi:hypothetical protein
LRVVLKFSARKTSVMKTNSGTRMGERARPSIRIEERRAPPKIVGWHRQFADNRRTEKTEAKGVVE